MDSPSIALDVESAIERLGDPELFLEVAHSFAGRLPEVARSIEEAFGKEDWQNAARLAHSLKSNCATVGAEAPRGKAAMLENALRGENREAAEALLKELAPMLPVLREMLLGLSTPMGG